MKKLKKVKLVKTEVSGPTSEDISNVVAFVVAGLVVVFAICKLVTL